MIDAHTHLQKIPASLLPTVLRRARDCDLLGAVVCGTSPDDWDDVKRLTAESDFDFHRGYGVHPWYVKNLQSGWQEHLRRYLQADSRAHVGEIGLDKHFPDLADLDTQKAVMAAQVEIAREFQRPITIHSVKAQAEIFQVLKVFSQTGLPMILHSFSGNLEQLAQFVKFSDNFYFSVNCKNNRQNVLRKIPENRLLLETDAPDQLATDSALEPLVSEAGKINDPAQIRGLIARVAEARGITEEVLKATVLHNTKAAFRLDI